MFNTLRQSLSDNAALKTLRRFLVDDSAPTAMEYALLLGAIALVVAGAAYALGGRIAEMFNRAEGYLR